MPKQVEVYKENKVAEINGKQTPYVSYYIKVGTQSLKIKLVEGELAKSILDNYLDK